EVIWPSKEVQHAIEKVCSDDYQHPATALLTLQVISGRRCPSPGSSGLIIETAYLPQNTRIQQLLKENEVFPIPSHKPGRQNSFILFGQFTEFDCLRVGVRQRLLNEYRLAFGQCLFRKRKVHMIGRRYQNGISTSQYIIKRGRDLGSNTVHGCEPMSAADYRINQCHHFDNRRCQRNRKVGRLGNQPTSDDCQLQGSVIISHSEPGRLSRRVGRRCSQATIIHPEYTQSWQVRCHLSRVLFLSLEFKKKSNRFSRASTTGEIPK